MHPRKVLLLFYVEESHHQSQKYSKKKKDANEPVLKDCITSTHAKRYNNKNLNHLGSSLLKKQPDRYKYFKIKTKKTVFYFVFGFERGRIANWFFFFLFVFSCLCVWCIVSFCYKYNCSFVPFFLLSNNRYFVPKKVPLNGKFKTNFSENIMENEFCYSK